jgi:hypothetical protein
VLQYHYDTYTSTYRYRPAVVIIAHRHKQTQTHPVLAAELVDHRWRLLRFGLSYSCSAY